MNWYLYIIKTEENTLYTGIAKDYERRFLEHLSGVGGAKFFRRYTPDKIVYLEEHSNRSKASVAEAYIKSLSAKEKRAFIKSYFPNILD
jgi:putative endonuclease